MTENDNSCTQDDILTLLRGWHSTSGKKLRWTDRAHGNKATLAHIEAVLTNVESSLTALHYWVADYLIKTTEEERLRGWLLYGIKNREIRDKVGWVKCPLTHRPAAFERHWRLFFRNNSDDADVIVLGGKEFDISYRHYVALLAELHSEWWKLSTHYDEPSVLAIHEGKPCDQDLCCFLCEEQTDAWRAHLMATYRSKNNIFLNPDCGKEFASLWLASVGAMSEAERAAIHWIWPPPFTYFDNRGAWEEKEVATLESKYVTYLAESRNRRYYTDTGRPLVEFERVRALAQALDDYHVPVFDTTDPDWKNDMFLFVSKFLMYGCVLLCWDKRCCAELIATYEALPDD